MKCTIWRELKIGRGHSAQLCAFRASDELNFDFAEALQVIHCRGWEAQLLEPRGACVTGIFDTGRDLQNAKLGLRQITKSLIEPLKQPRPRSQPSTSRVLVVAPAIWAAFRGTMFFRIDSRRY